MGEVPLKDGKNRENWENKLSRQCWEKNRTTARISQYMKLGLIREDADDEEAHAKCKELDEARGYKPMW